MADDTKDEQKKPEAEAVTTEDKKSKKSKKKAKDPEFDNATTVHVKIYSPYKVYYEGDAESVSAENLTGPFDILPRHYNFITLLRECDIDIRSAKSGDKKVHIQRGVMHVRRNIVTVFLDV